MPYQGTSSRFFVCPSVLFNWHSNQLTILVSDVDSGHSDQQPTNDGPEREEDGKDEGAPSSSLLRRALPTRVPSNHHVRLEAHH
jgi:hypothetical protein